MFTYSYVHHALVYTTAALYMLLTSQFALANKDKSTKATESGSTLASVLKAGYLKCGVSQGLPGFSSTDAKNNWTGLDVDYCKAMAAAVFNDPSKVKYTPTSSKERFTALQSGEIDVLSRNTTWTTSRDTALGFDFAGVTYYDGQGFMVAKKSKISEAKQLNGATVCVQTGTTTELNLADYFKSNNLKYKLVAFETNEEAKKAYETGRCDTLTTDRSGLYSTRSKLKKPDEHVVLPDVISKEPLGPVVRHGDNQWTDIARWVVYALLEAEEMGVTQGNVDEMMKSSKNPVVRRLLGLDGELGSKLGLSNKWSYQVIKHVGNYGEVFERNLGESSNLKIARGKNALWKDGGLMYAMPMR